MLRKLCLLLVFYFLQATLGSFKRHKYAIDVESGSLCSDNAKLEVPMRTFTVDRVNRTHRAFNMDFTFAQPLDDTAEGTMFMDKWSNGKWINIPFLPFQKNPCATAMTMSPPQMLPMWLDMEKAMKIKNPGKCPIAAGNYSMSGYVIDMRYDIPFFSGRFKAMPVFRRVATRQKIFCAVIILNFLELLN